jgi:hypothetical protein
MLSSAVSLWLLAASPAEAASTQPYRCVTHVETDDGWTSTLYFWGGATAIDDLDVRLVAPIPVDSLARAEGAEAVVDGDRIVGFEMTDVPSTITLHTTGATPAVPDAPHQWLWSSSRVPGGGRVVTTLFGTKDPGADASYCCPFRKEAKKGRGPQGHSIDFSPDETATTGLPFELKPARDPRPLMAVAALGVLALFVGVARKAARWAEWERTEDYIEKEFGKRTAAK